MQMCTVRVFSTIRLYEQHQQQQQHDKLSIGPNYVHVQELTRRFLISQF